MLLIFTPGRNVWKLIHIYSGYVEDLASAILQGVSMNWQSIKDIKLYRSLV